MSKPCRGVGRPVSFYHSRITTHSCKSITFEVLQDDSPSGHITGERCAGTAHLTAFPVEK